MMLAYGLRFLFILFLAYPSAVRADIAIPPLTGHVIDQTATLTIAQQQQLEQTLQIFESKKGSQIAVLIIPTTSPETIEQFAIRLADIWKLGRKKIDDGVILIVAKNDRNLRLEVGYGLEGVLGDAISKRIISETITPSFRQGDFYAGIEAGVNQIIRVVSGEPLPPPEEQTFNSSSDIRQYFPIMFILVLVVGQVSRSIFGRFLGAILTGGIIAFLAWFFAGVFYIALISGVIALLFTLLSTGATGTMLLRNLGHGGFGGGGFGGGGGGFGGGGSSGRW